MSEEELPYELKEHTIRMMEETPHFFMWINGDFAETVFDYYVHQQMDEAMRLYG